MGVLLPACSSRQPYTKETFVMGTKAWVTIAGMKETDADSAATEAFREMYRIESVMSTWRPQSEISRLNAESNGAPFPVSRELYSLVDSSLFYAKATSGAFDVTVRPLVLLWGFQGGEARIPSKEDVERALASVGYESITLDSIRSTVTLPVGMQIDLAGIAKGYAVDRCVSVLARRGVENALVNIGGNIYAMGEAPGEKGWRIGIRDPKGALETVGSLLLRNEAVATSGNYENFVEIDGKRYGHIIDPRTGWPVSDVLSTGLFVLGPARANDAVARLGSVRALFALPRGEDLSYKEIGNFNGTLTLAGGRPLGRSH
jgi:thiamine biosynthesis lipoprotein